MTRLLPHIRLSDLSDETTSPERQKEKIQGHVRRDDTIVAWTEDLDVSGKISPFERKSLGPWLTDPAKIGQWDALVVARFDRISRNINDFCQLAEWLKERGKALICLEPEIDMTTPGGRALAQMLAVFAEYEREMIAARVKDAVTSLRNAGQYAGGTCPFGLMPFRLAGKGWGFIPDPEFAPVVAEMARRFLGGESLNQIADWLNDEHIPTSQDVMRRRQNVLRREQGKPEKPERGTKWRHSTVSKVLGSPALIGDMTKDGGVLRDADGMPIGRCDPIISAEDFALIQKKLETNSDRTGPRVNSAVLLRVAYCGGCGSVLHMNTATSGNNAKPGSKVEYRYYECSGRRTGNGCTERKIRAELVEDELKRMVLGEVGSRKMTRKVVTPATDNSEAHQRITDAIDALTDKLGRAEISAEVWQRAVARLEDSRKPLGPVVKREEHIGWEETAETVAQHWAAVENRGDLNSFLRDKGVTIHVRRAKKGEGPSLRGEGRVLAQLAKRKGLPPLQAEEGGLIAKVYLADLNALATA